MDEALTEMNQVIAAMDPVERKLIERQMEIATKISTMMEQRGWNITMLAKQSHIARPHLSRVLAGVDNFTLKTLSKIETAFNEDILQVKSNIPDLEWTPEVAAFWGKTISLSSDGSNNETRSTFLITEEGWVTERIDKVEASNSSNQLHKVDDITIPLLPKVT